MPLILTTHGYLHNVDDLLLFTGQRVWRQSYGSPVISIYSVEGGDLRKVAMTSVAADTLDLLTGSSVLAIRADTFGIKATDSSLQLVCV